MDAILQKRVEPWLRIPFDEKTRREVQDLIENHPKELEDAFYKQTSTLSLHDVIKIVSEHSPVDLSYAARRRPVSDRIVLYENLAGSFSKVEFLIHADRATRVAIFRRISAQE